MESVQPTETRHGTSSPLELTLYPAQAIEDSMIDVTDAEAEMVAAFKNAYLNQSEQTQLLLTPSRLINKKNMTEKYEVPVTSIIRRYVQPGRESDFREWTGGIDKACRKFPGFKDLNLIYPEETGGEYVTILSFDTFDNYLTWENSPERAFWLQSVRAMTDGEVNRELIRGFGYWLGSDNNDGKTWPPKFRMIVVAYAAIWPLAYFISPLLAHYLPATPLPASLLSTGVITLLMGYVTLPLVQRIMLPWLKKG